MNPIGFKALNQIFEFWRGRRISISREISKIYEETVGNISGYITF